MPAAAAPKATTLLSQRQEERRRLRQQRQKERHNTDSPSHSDRDLRADSPGKSRPQSSSSLDSAQPTPSPTVSASRPVGAGCSKHLQRFFVQEKGKEEEGPASASDPSSETSAQHRPTQQNSDDAVRSPTARSRSSLGGKRRSRSRARLTPSTASSTDRRGRSRLSDEPVQHGNVHAVVVPEEDRRRESSANRDGKRTPSSTRTGSVGTHRRRSSSKTPRSRRRRILAVDSDTDNNPDTRADTDENSSPRKSSSSSSSAHLRSRHSLRRGSSTAGRTQNDEVSPSPISSRHRQDDGQAVAANGNSSNSNIPSLADTIKKGNAKSSSRANNSAYPQSPGIFSKSSLNSIDLTLATAEETVSASTINSMSFTGHDSNNDTDTNRDKQQQQQQRQQPPRMDQTQVQQDVNKLLNQTLATASCVSSGSHDRSRSIERQSRRSAPAGSSHNRTTQRRRGSLSASRPSRRSRAREDSEDEEDNSRSPSDSRSTSRPRRRSRSRSRRPSRRDYSTEEGVRTPGANGSSRRERRGSFNSIRVDRDSLKENEHEHINSTVTPGKSPHSIGPRRRRRLSSSAGRPRSIGRSPGKYNATPTSRRRPTSSTTSMEASAAEAAASLSIPSAPFERSTASTETKSNPSGKTKSTTVGSGNRKKTRTKSKQKTRKESTMSNTSSSSSKNSGTVHSPTRTKRSAEALRKKKLSKTYVESDSEGEPESPIRLIQHRKPLNEQQRSHSSDGVRQISDTDDDATTSKKEPSSRKIKYISQSSKNINGSSSTKRALPSRTKSAPLSLSSSSHHKRVVDAANATLIASDMPTATRHSMTTSTATSTVASGASTMTGSNATASLPSSPDEESMTALQLRFQKDFPDEPVPSNAILEKLYKDRPVSHTLSGEMGHSAAPLTVPRISAGLVRQNSDSNMSFATEATWEGFGGKNKKSFKETSAAFLQNDAIQEEEDDLQDSNRRQIVDNDEQADPSNSSADELEMEMDESNNCRITASVPSVPASQAVPFGTKVSLHQSTGSLESALSFPKDWNVHPFHHSTASFFTASTKNTAHTTQSARSHSGVQSVGSSGSGGEVTNQIHTERRGRSLGISMNDDLSRSEHLAPSYQRRVSRSPMRGVRPTPPRHARSAEGSLLTTDASITANIEQPNWFPSSFADPKTSDFEGSSNIDTNNPASSFGTVEPSNAAEFKGFFDTMEDGLAPADQPAIETATAGDKRGTQSSFADFDGNQSLTMTDLAFPSATLASSSSVHGRRRARSRSRSRSMSRSMHDSASSSASAARRFHESFSSSARSWADDNDDIGEYSHNNNDPVNKGFSGTVTSTDADNNASSSGDWLADFGSTEEAVNTKTTMKVRSKAAQWASSTTTASRCGSRGMNRSKSDMGSSTLESMQASLRIDQSRNGMANIGAKITMEPANRTLSSSSQNGSRMPSRGHANNRRKDQLSNSIHSVIPPGWDVEQSIDKPESDPSLAFADFQSANASEQKATAKTRHQKKHSFDKTDNNESSRLFGNASIASLSMEDVFEATASKPTTDDSQKGTGCDNEDEMDMFLKTLSTAPKTPLLARSMKDEKYRRGVGSASRFNGSVRSREQIRSRIRAGEAERRKNRERAKKSCFAAIDTASTSAAVKSNVLGDWIDDQDNDDSGVQGVIEVGETDLISPLTAATRKVMTSVHRRRTRTARA